MHNQEKITFKELLQNWGIQLLVLGWFIITLIPYGPAVTFDTVSFLEAGENFFSTGHYVHSGAHGDEFAAHRFPLYPLLLSVFNFSKISVFVLQIGLFAGSLFFFKRIVSLAQSPNYLLIGFAFTGIVLNYYCLWTESLFGLIFLAFIYQLKLNEENLKLKRLLLLIALLCLTRLAGVVVGGSLFLALALQSNIKNGLKVLGATFLVTGTWVVLGTFFLGSTAREFTLHLVPIAKIKGSAVALAEYLVPLDIHIRFKYVLGIILFFWPLALALKFYKGKKKLPLTELFLIVHFYAYFIFIWLSISFVDASVPLEFRTLLPVYLNLLVLFAFRFMPIQQTLKFESVKRFLIPLMIAICFLMNIRGVFMIHDNGIGYNSKSWRTFEFPNQIKALEGNIVHTNDKSAVTYFAEHINTVRTLPERKSLYTLKVNNKYAREMEAVSTVLIVDSTNYIVWVRNGITADVYPSYEELKNNDKYEIVYDDWLCLILKYKFL